MWEIARATVGTEELLRYLKEGWEPFAVSCTGNTELAISLAIVWLRKKFA